MKDLFNKLGYILTIGLGGLFLYFLVGAQGLTQQNNGYLGQAVLGVVGLLTIGGAIAGLLKHPLGKKVTLITLAVITILAALSGHIEYALPVAALFALVFFAK